MERIAAVLVLGFCALPAGAAPLRVAVVDIAAAEGVTTGQGAALTQAVVGEVRKLGGIDVVTQQEVAAVLTLEQQKQLLGCASDKCRAELGGVLGVDRLLMGDLSRLGESWLFHLKLVDVRQAKTVSQVDRRQKGGTVDDLLDALPAMAKQLFAGEAKDPGAPVSAAAVAPVVRPTVPPNGVDEPVPAADVPRDVTLLSDGKGRFLAYAKGSTWTLWTGDGRRFHEVPVTGGGSTATSWDKVFWEPRVNERWRGSLAFNDGAHTLTCGEQKVALAPVPDAARALKDVQWLKPRFRRRAVALGRDDNAVYYLVDESRDRRGTDHRLWVGRKTAMKPAVVEDVAADDGGLLVVTPTGRLRVDRQAKTMEWLEGQAVTRLKHLDLETFLAQGLLWGELSVYRSEPLGTPCDGRL